MPSINAASQRHPSKKPLSPIALVIQSVFWGLAATVIVIVLCFIPGINLFCYGLLIVVGSIAVAIGIPERFIEVSICVLVPLTFFTFFSVLRHSQLVRRNNLFQLPPNDRHA